MVALGAVAKNLMNVLDLCQSKVVFDETLKDIYG